MNYSKEVAKLKKSSILIILWITIALIVTTSATYAWFTYNGSTKVTEGYGTISSDLSLLISQSKEGPFEESCEMPYSDTRLTPITTTDLIHFYVPEKSAKDGTPLSYKEISDSIDDYAVTGTLYLKCDGESCDIYLYGPGCDFGIENDYLKASKLGLITTVNGEVNTYIIDLDDTSKYMASGEGDNLKEAEISIGSLNEGEIFEVKYFLYLEGNDPDCVNKVINTEVILKLFFAGI